MSTPDYVPGDELSRLPITHEWDDWDPFEPLDWPDDELKRRLARVSDIGITCFALGCAEWVTTRFDRYLDDPAVTHYLEALWAVCFGVLAALPPPTDHDHWLGPVRGPVNLALMTVLNTVYLAEHGPPVQNGALAAVIVEHVCGEQLAFDEWREAVVDRLERFAGRSPAEPMGRPLPREILDPEHPWDDGERVELLIRGYTGLDRTSNPFLADLNDAIVPDGQFLVEES